MCLYGTVLHDTAPYSQFFHYKIYYAYHTVHTLQGDGSENKKIKKKLDPNSTGTIVHNLKKENYQYFLFWIFGTIDTGIQLFKKYFYYSTARYGTVN